MARGDKTANILDEIAREAAAEPEAAAPSPDFVDIGGVRYFKDKVQASDPQRRVKKAYVNPKRPMDAPVEMELEQVTCPVSLP